MRQRKPFENAGSGKLRAPIQASLLRLMNSTPWLRRQFQDAGDIASYMEWLKSNFSDVQISSRREYLWAKIAEKIGDSGYRGVEFGVAYGYLTQ